MRKLLLLFYVFIFAYSDTYFARVEPLEIYKIKASISGEVIFSNLSKEGKYIENALILKIDDAVNIKDLKISKQKLKILQDIFLIDKQRVKDSERSFKLQERNYNRIKDLKTKSSFEKDNRLVSVLNTKSAYLNAKQNLENLKTSINALKYKIFVLEDTISKKNIKLQNRFLYKLYVKNGDFVVPGTILMDTADIKKAKLTVYLSYEDMINLNKKSIFLNGKKTNRRFYRVWKIADKTNISSYKAEMIIPAPKIFSKVVKIEIK